MGVGVKQVLFSWLLLPTEEHRLFVAATDLLIY